MEISLEQYNKIQRYLDNAMNQTEEIEFEQELKENPLLREYYIFESELRDTIEIKELEQNIRGFTFSGTQENENSFTNLTGVKGSQTHIHPKGNGIIRKMMPYLAAAALAGIIVSLFLIIPKWQEKKVIAVQRKIDSMASTKNDSVQSTTNNIKDTVHSILIAIQKEKKELALGVHKKKKIPSIKNHPSSGKNNFENVAVLQLGKTGNEEFDSLNVPKNEHYAMNSVATRGDVYGEDDIKINIENNTRFVVDIYINGKFKVSIAPWDSLATYAISGNTKLVAKAELNHTDYRIWGPKIIYLKNQYLWKLN